MHIQTARSAPENIKADLLAIGHYEGVSRLNATVQTLDKALDGMLAAEIAEQRFEGKTGQTLLLATHGALPAKRILLVGLGKRALLTLNTVRKAAAASVRKAKEVSAKTIATTLLGAEQGDLKPEQIAMAIAEAALLADYEFLAYKTQDKEEAERRIIETLTVIESERRRIAAIERGIAGGRINSEPVIYARNLVNEPASQLTPARLLDEAKKMAELPGVTLEYFDEAQAGEKGMGAFCGVAQGSDEPSYFIHLTYRPRGQGVKKRIVLIGKGITFDSGGLSLKPAQHMETMKIDMSGAAAVLAVFSALPDIRPHLEIHGIIPATENMPSGRAQKPGDVVRTISGKTIEVVNTDAEGRLTIADALGYAQALEPDTIIDLATLTGSCVVALGEEVAGLFATDPRLGQRIKDAAERSGEPVWEMPLVESYEEFLKSDIADFRNIAKVRYGDAIVAALFMKQFAGDTPWAHLDIAGPAWQERADNPMIPKGATGFGIRTLLELIKHL